MAFEANFLHAMLQTGMNVDSLFQDKPWVYAHLLEIQRRVGRENFPLIDQVFYPSHRDMVSIASFRSSLSIKTLPLQDHKGNYPCVFKIGHAHGGLGKVRVENSGGFQVKEKI